VVGYRAEDIRTRLGDSFRGVPIRYADNADWATTPNAESLVRAAPFLGERPTLLCDGDLVIAPGGLKLALPDDADLLLVTDPEVALDDEAMKVIPDQGGQVAALRKNSAAGTAEFIGVSLWREIRPLIAAIRALPPGEVKYYEDGINRLLDRGKLRAVCHEIAPFTWAEIDTEEDYRRATKLDLDYSPHLMRVVTEMFRSGDAVIRGALAKISMWHSRPRLCTPNAQGTGEGACAPSESSGETVDKPHPGRIGAGASLLVGALLALAGILAALAGHTLTGILLAFLGTAGGMAEHFPDQSPRLLRLGRFLDRAVDLGLPVALVAPILPDPEALLAAAITAAVFFLYYFTGISYLLIIPRSSFLSNPEDLKAMNRAWLERGGALPLDRGGLLVILSLCIALLPLPVVSAFLVFSLLAFLLWAWQSIRAWSLIRA
jgi:choline kinase